MSDANHIRPTSLQWYTQGDEMRVSMSEADYRALSAGASGGGDDPAKMKPVCSAPRDGRTCYPECGCDTEADCEYGAEYVHPTPTSPATGKKTPDVLIDLGWVHPIAATPQPESASGELVMVPRELVKFLNGDAPLDGHWYGDRTYPVVDGVHSPYWWRKYLNAAPHSQQAPAQGREG